MRVRALRSSSLFAGVALIAVAVTGCGEQKGAGDDGKVSARRARQVAAAWDGSSAAAAWRGGFHPMGEVVQLPRGGWRSKDDERAYREHGFVLRGALPGGGPKDGRVAWASGGSLTRPVAGAAESYKALAGGLADGRGRLTVTGAKLGTMTVATTRGPAVVPAWLFSLDGYGTPLKRSAVTASPLPRPPIGWGSGVPGLPLDRVVRIDGDGRSVTVVALDGACDAGPVVAVLETSGSVVLSGSVKGPKHADCTAQARLRQVTVRLARPVGDRVVLDAHTGRPIPYRPTDGASPSWS